MKIFPTETKFFHYVSVFTHSPVGGKSIGIRKIVNYPNLCFVSYASYPKNRFEPILGVKIPLNVCVYVENQMNVRLS